MTAGSAWGGGGKSPATSRQPLIVMRKLVSLVGLCLLTLLALVGRAETVQIYHIGVGQGDATLIIVTNNAKEKASVLIDAGNGSSKGTAVFGVLQTLLGDVKRVDVIITSHLHSDHLGGMYQVVSSLRSNNWKIGTVLDRAAQGYIGDDSCYTETAADLIDYLNDNTPQLPSSQLVKNYSGFVKPLYQLGVLNWFNVAAGIEVFSTFVRGFQTNAQLRCLTSNGYVCKTAKDYSDWNSYGGSAHNENDYSYSFLFELNSFKYFTGGDIGGEAPYVDLETPLVSFFKTRPDAGTFHFCAYKASHHGSLHSTNPAFVTYTKPTLTVVPSALRSFSGTKLPSEATLTRLDGVSSALRYTYIWSSSSTRSSGSVTDYRDVGMVVHDTAYETNHQMRVCSATRRKSDLQLVTSTWACETITCGKHTTTTMLAREAPDATRLAFEKAVSVPPPGEVPVPSVTPEPAAAPAPEAHRHHHFWPWRWGHRHAAEPTDH